MQLDEMIARDGLEPSDLIGLRVEVAMVDPFLHYWDPIRPHGTGTVVRAWRDTVDASLLPDPIDFGVGCVVQFDDPAGAGRSGILMPWPTERDEGRCMVQAKNLRPAAVQPDAPSHADGGPAVGASVSS
jgi:hypothetical protein